MRWIAGALIAGALVSVAIGWWTCSRVERRFETPGADASPDELPTFVGLMDIYVTDDGRVDYARWHANERHVAALDAHLAQATAASPDSHPHRFGSGGASAGTTSSDRAKLSYWLNLYNALVVREVLRHWPVDSVNDIRPGSLSFVKQGKGFFYDTTFVVGGRRMSLLDIENEIIRQRFRDPRIHFALNCGSASCPVLSRSVFVDDALDRQLDEATRTFINDQANVRVDHEARELLLSRIFDWYTEDFLRDEPTLVDFLLDYASADLRGDLEKARQYDLAFLSYDWSVNAREASSSPSRTRGVGSPLPNLALSTLDGVRWEPVMARGSALLIDVWATYCKPCRQGLREVAALASAFPELVVMTVSMDADDEAVRAFLRDLDVELPVALDAHGSAAARLEVTMLPTTIVVDRKGIVRFRGQDRQKLRAAVERALTE